MCLFGMGVLNWNVRRMFWFGCNVRTYFMLQMIWNMLGNDAKVYLVATHCEQVKKKKRKKALKLIKSWEEKFGELPCFFLSMSKSKNVAAFISEVLSCIVSSGGVEEDKRIVSLEAKIKAHRERKKVLLVPPVLTSDDFIELILTSGFNESEALDAAEKLFTLGSIVYQKKRIGDEHKVQLVIVDPIWISTIFSSVLNQRGLFENGMFIYICYLLFRGY